MWQFPLKLETVRSGSILKNTAYKNDTKISLVLKVQEVGIVKVSCLIY